MRIFHILIIGITFIIACSCSENMHNNKSISKKETQTSEITAEEFVDRIDSLGYFRYAEVKYLDTLKKNHLESFNSEGSWGGIWDDETYIPFDFRYYFCDGETVFEQEGFTDMLEEMKPTFDKIGFKLTIDNHFEEWDIKNEWLNHRITVNNTEYVVFKNFKGYGWGEAVQRLAEIVNIELEKQNINERIYLISGGNDGFLIFLDHDLYNYFYEVFTDPQWKPLEVSEWSKVMGIKPMKLK